MQKKSLSTTSFDDINDGCKNIWLKFLKVFKIFLLIKSFSIHNANKSKDLICLIHAKCLNKNLKKANGMKSEKVLPKKATKIVHNKSVFFFLLRIVQINKWNLEGGKNKELYRTYIFFFRQYIYQVFSACYFCKFMSLSSGWKISPSDWTLHCSLAFSGIPRLASFCWIWERKWHSELKDTEAHSCSARSHKQNSDSPCPPWTPSSQDHPYSDLISASFSGSASSLLQEQIEMWLLDYDGCSP